MLPQTVLVTGGASGIGLALVRRLASDGSKVVVVDLDELGGARAAREAGGRFLRADVGDEGDWERVAREVTGLGAAYLNAGVTTGKTNVTALSVEEYQRVVRVNVDGVVLGVRALVPAMTHGAGLVVTASLAGLTPMPSDPVYTLTKHAVIGFVRAVAPQLVERGIRINAVCPGIVDTPLLSQDERAALARAEFPLLAPEEVADAAVAALQSGETGCAWACQPGREPLRYEFRGVPGPRVPGATGVPPPL